MYVCTTDYTYICVRRRLREKNKNKKIKNEKKQFETKKSASIVDTKHPRQ
jgi:hypothetical protein